VVSTGDKRAVLYWSGGKDSAMALHEITTNQRYGGYCVASLLTGEFHTFVFDGPIFRQQVRCKLGKVVQREGFYFCDVVPDDGFEP
jgi:diphthamide synthase (EF-2-diphthine--ammonia ligase)